MSYTNGNMSDPRSLLDKAREEWLESDQVKLLIQLTQQFSPAEEVFIKNRLLCAFTAGAEAQRAIMEQGKPETLRDVLKEALEQGDVT